ncbi:type VI secretion system-associated protein TagF [Rheinheimera maricola]|uniref:Type VI secretion system-associated protein TagF n=1 Tax=Rheinheimera maricola TaxID=2793282 RepID=A0ABS7XFK3_9GAMM|nr:type VI secretion system-associated protein TagF [Rheinheimera maricola]MBZ9613438.1 type VI secretion system-associated protein TagF [Rheinheimera maricola]
MAGYYGKITKKGDFISKGLSHATINTLHDFFSGGLENSIDELGSKWLERYSVAPVWYFYLQAGILGDSPFIGIWVSSVDRVGRHFPMTILQPLQHEIVKISELTKYKDWYCDAENLLFDTLNPSIDEKNTLDAIEALSIYNVGNVKGIEILLNCDGITELPKPQPSTALEKYLLEKIAELEGDVLALKIKVEELSHPLQNESVPAILSINTNYALKAEKINNFNFAESFNGHSIWFSRGNDDITSQLFFQRGFPESKLFTHFLTGCPA